jgi:excinuclease ABC subunit A
MCGFVEWFDGLPGQLDNNRLALAEDVLREIRHRCLLLVDVGLGYLGLDRQSSTLSGGEAQRIRLAGQLGCGLNNLLYVLDEPSMGLHPRDHARMLQTIKESRDGGNTVVVVEHDASTMRAADFIIDMGPGAGRYGGEIIASGTPREIMCHPDSGTGAYLSGKKRVVPEDYQRVFEPYGWLRVKGANVNNLKSIDVAVPLGCIAAVTGVSGSGKSSLVHQVICPSVGECLGGRASVSRFCCGIEGTEGIDKLIMVDQSPIGRTPRSNPASYTGLWDGVRSLFASTPEAKRRGYGPNRFSFNNKEGACLACQGDGRMRTEMHFMPDVWAVCPRCRGKRFRPEILEILWNGVNVADVLDMEIASAQRLFYGHGKVYRILRTLSEVGLGYLKLGQSALDLSGGEAQRVKLARELCRPDTGRTLYVLDEPTTGLHFEDLRYLLNLFFRLKKKGNTILFVEHNLDLIAAADYIIDLGPEGGEGGGYVVVQGTAEEVMNTPESYTGHYLRREMGQSGV